MRLLGVYDLGEEPSADESQDALASLNSMIASWSLERGFIHAETLDVIPLVANQPSVTVGPSGTFPTVRPLKVLPASYIRYQGVVYQLTVWELADYTQIAVQNVGGIPVGVWPLMNFPDITITPWPLPATAMDLYLWSQKELSTFPTLTTTVTLPPGYDRALAFCLAEEIAGEYAVEPSLTVVRKAAWARKNIKRINAVNPRLDMPYGIPLPGDTYYGGWWGT